ncbi:MAG: S1 RNA-binding domain-containing protein, partial [Bryobacteraceae bacterium]
MSPELENTTNAPSSPTAAAADQAPNQTNETFRTESASAAATAPAPESAQDVAQEAALESTQEAPRLEEAAGAPASADGSAETPAAAAGPEVEGTGEMSAEAMGELIEQYQTPQAPSTEQETLEGRVVALIEQGVVVDIGAKREGLIPAQEFSDNSSGPLPVVGQPIEVDRTGQEKDGYILLSHQRAHRRAVWKKIEESFRAKAAIEGSVVDLIKGGLIVEIGVRAFLPASQVDLRPQTNLESWKGQTITCRVIKMNRKRGNV